ncbi:MAG: hypothetical protein C4540_05465 [Candidatus Omnitrophota bacterium]|jgi:hypothetical protein|nr:MAG: hypothetical protein C4540_05465 [Candidatus Omnitrophota bacterium]
MLIGALLFFVGYLFQCWPRFFNPYFGVDVWRNLSIADEIRKYKRLPRRNLPKYMLKGPFDYPPLLNIFLSLFSKKWLEKYQGFIAPLFDAITGFILFSFTLFLTREVAVALLAQLLFVTNPLAAMENASLTARSLGNLTFSLTFLFIILFTVFHSWAYFLLAIIFGFLVIFAQKMASQALIMISVIFMLFRMDVSYVLIVSLSILVALLLAGDLYVRIASGHLSVLRYFRKILDNRYAHQVSGNIALKGGNDFIDKVKSYVNKQPFLAMLASAPLVTMGLVLSLWGLIFIPKSFSIPPELYLYHILFQFCLWLIVLYYFGILTAQVRAIQFLGEGMKYLVFASFPASFIVAYVSFYEIRLNANFIPLVFSLVVVAMSVAQTVFLQKKGIVNDRQRTLTPVLRQVMDFLQNEPGEIRLATIPFSLSDIIAYFTKCNVFSSDSAFVLGNDPAYTDFYPVLKRPLEEILSVHNINYLLIDKNYVNPEALQLAAGSKIVLERENLCLIKR